MLNRIKIADFMTENPFTVEADQKIHHAQRIMKLTRVRNLPVVVGERLVGILNEADIKASHNYRFREDLSIADIMQEDPYVVDMDTSLGEVIRDMFDFKYEAVLVTRGHRALVGIFTRQDVLRLLLQDDRSPQESVAIDAFQPDQFLAA